MQKSFVSYELKVSCYELLNMEKTTIFLKVHNIQNKGVLNSNFIDLYKSIAFTMHKSNMHYYKCVFLL